MHVRVGRPPRRGAREVNRRLTDWRLALGAMLYGIGWVMVVLGIWVGSTYLVLETLRYVIRWVVGVAQS